MLEKETEPKDKPTRRKSISDVLNEGSGLTNRSRDRKKVKKSKITQKELNDAVKFLQTINNHEELLVAMGMSPEEIVKYNGKKTKPEK